LGNCLFTYARAVACAIENEAQLITPEWFQLNVGPLLRGTKSRNYRKDFKALECDISGLNKAKLLFKYPRYCECEWAYRSTYSVSDANCIIECKGMKDWFRSLNPHRAAITAAIRERLRQSYRDYSGSVAVHVRLGDFAVASREDLHAGARNVRAPFSWYQDVLADILRDEPNKKIVYFTDAKAAELADLASAYPGEIVSGQSAISDMFSLSTCDVIVGTRSTFALWGYFFSNATLCLPSGPFQPDDWMPAGRGILYYK